MLKYLFNHPETVQYTVKIVSRNVEDISDVEDPVIEVTLSARAGFFSIWITYGLLIGVLYKKE